MSRKQHRRQTRRIGTLLVSLGLASTASISQAAWTGGLIGGTATDVNFSYNTAANPPWSGGTVENTFSPALSGATTLFFGSDFTTTDVFTLGYSGAFALTLQGGGQVNNAGGATAAANHTITLTNNVSVALSGDQPITLGSSTANNQLSLDLNGAVRTFTIDTGDILSLVNNVTGAGGITKAGAGALFLNGSATYDGLTTVSGGTLRVFNSNSLGSTVGGTTVTGSGNLQLSGTSGGTIFAAEPLTISGEGPGTNGVLRNITSNSTWTGNITVAAASITRVVSDAGIFTINGNIALSPTATDQFVLQGPGTGIINGIISGASRVTRGATGSGAWTLNGANTFTGFVQISNGSLRVATINSVVGGTASSNLGAPNSVANGTILIGGTGNTGTLVYTGPGETTDRVIDLSGTTGGAVVNNSGTGPLKFSSNLTASGIGSKTLTLTGASTFTGELGGAIINNSSTNVTSLSKTGTGTWILSGASSYAGTTSISDGILNIRSSTALGSSAAGTTISGATSLQLQGNLTIAGETLSLTNSATFHDSTTGAGVFTNVSGNSTWSGNITADTSGTLLRIGAIAGKLTISGNLTTTSATTQIVISQGNGDIEYSGIIDGPAQITKGVVGTGNLILSGTNTYTGITQLSGGTTLVNTNAPNNAAGAFGISATPIQLLTAALPNANAALLTNGAFTVGRDINVMNSTGMTATIGGATANVSSYTGTINMARPTIYSQAANGTVNFTGDINGSQPATIDGAGTVVFGSAPKTYTGTTTINSLAKLLVNSSTTSSTNNFTVNGTLGGSGSIAGSVNVGAGGRLAPGNSIGTLTIANSVTLADGALFTFELGATGDLVSMSGQTLNLNSQEFADFTFLPETGFAPGSYTLFDAGTISGVLGASTTGLINFGGTDYNAQIAVSGNDLVLNVAAIPEPGTMAVACLAALLSYPTLRRWRKRSAS